ncbi:two-component regulator propeller domain-containing protein [Roseateles sp. So40a]|uniref:sensor histidine kinase n=1 Tax=Roseateles sp. So40a TaxID=3400226 RepID=UPI003A8C4180
MAGLALLLAVASFAAEPPAPPAPTGRITLPQLLKEQPLDQLFHTGWGAREGFHGPVMGLAQTTDGYLWVGTSQGLFRFDGVRFERFETLAGETLQSKAVLSLFATPDNGLWVGFMSGGAAFVRDGHILSSEPAKEGFGASTRAFVREKDGTIWAANSRGVFRREGERWKEMGKAENYPAVGPGQYTMDLQIDGDGNIWAFTTKGMLVRPAGQTRFVDVPTPNRRPSYAAVDPQGRIWARMNGPHYVRLPRPNVPSDVMGSGRPVHTSMFMPIFDRDGYLWYGAFDGIVRERVSDRPIDTDDELPANVGAPPPMPLVPLTAASSVTPGSAAQAYNFEAPALQRLTPSQGLTGDRVLKVFQDREGSIWIGTNAGLDRLRSTRVSTFQFPVRTSTLAMAAGPKGDVWFTSRLGVLHLNAAGQGSDLELFPSESISMSKVLVDHAGTVWVGDQAGLSRLTPDGRYVNELKAAVPDWNGGVTDLMEDSTGTIWLMAQMFGPMRRSPDGKWEKLAGQRGFPNATFHCMALDLQGRIWLGSGANRLFRVEPGDQLTRITEKEGVNVGDLMAITPGKGHLWIGGSNGVQRRDDNGSFHTLKAQSDEAFNDVSGIVETPEGDLWLNGQAGITRVLAADVRRAMSDPTYRVPVLQLGTQDGLPGRAETSFPLNTALRTPDGRLWFSLTNALVTIDPATLKNDTAPPAVDVQRVMVNGIALQPTKAHFVEADAGTRDLQIDYASMSLAVPERARFRYRLRGLETEWHDAGARRQAFYTNLGPGRYDFEVQATHDDIAWSATPAAMAIDIPPTFTQSKTFRVLCVLAALALIALLAWLRLRQLEGRALERYRARLEERTRIAQDLHDTLLQGFQGLLLRFQRVAWGIPNELPARAEMERVLDRADEIVIEGRHRITDLRQAPSDAGPLESALESLGKDLAEYHDARFTIEVEGTSRPLETCVRSELALVGREGLFNAFQHAQASCIALHLNYAETGFSLRIVDDGVGVPLQVQEEGQRPGHWGLSGMRERVLRLGGSFELRSAPGQGAEIIVSVPAALAYPSAVDRPVLSKLQRGAREMLGTAD